MITLDALLEADANNVASAKQVLEEIAPRSLESVSLANAILDRLGDEFGKVVKLGKSEVAIRDWARSANLSQRDAVKFLAEATLIGTPTGKDDTKTAASAVNSGLAGMATVTLLLLLGRDYLFGMTNLLRNRLSSALGYFRVQSETVGILELIRQNPEAAKDWWETITEKGGTEFYKKYHAREVVVRLKKHGLREDYDVATSFQMHCRTRGVGYGLTAERSVDGRSVALRYQDIDDPILYLLWFCVYQRFYRRVFAAIPKVLPEIATCDVVTKDIREYGQRVDLLFENLRPHMEARKGTPIPSWLLQKE